MMHGKGREQHIFLQVTKNSDESNMRFMNHTCTISIVEKKLGDPRLQVDPNISHAMFQRGNDPLVAARGEASTGKK